MKPFNKVKKAASYLTILCFLLNTVSISQAFAAKSQSSVSFKIPAQFGTIEKTFKGSSSFPVIYIQDAHSSFEAQENIAKLITHLVKSNGIKTVFTEGYEGEIPLDQLFPFDSAEVKEKVSRRAMDYLRLSGAQYAFVNRTQNFKLIGIDGMREYLANLKAYELAAKNREAIAEDLNAISKELKALGDRLYPKEIKEWLKLKNRLDTKKISMSDYLSRFMKMSGLKTETAFPDLKKISGSVFFERLSSYESSYTNRFLKDENVRAVLKYQRGIELFSRLNLISITPEEYAQIESSRGDFRTEAMAKFLAKNLKKTIVVKKEWESLIENAIQFYETAKKRDLIFQNNLKLNGPSILVTGGFHKEAMLRHLEANHISYILVSPKITQEDLEHQKRYDFLMSGKFYNDEKPFMNLYPIISAAQQETQPLLLLQGVKVVDDNVAMARQLFPGQSVISEEQAIAASLGAEVYAAIVTIAEVTYEAGKILEATKDRIIEWSDPSHDVVVQGESVHEWILEEFRLANFDILDRVFSEDNDDEHVKFLIANSDTVEAASLGDAGALRKAYTNKEAFVHYMEEELFPIFLKQYPEMQELYEAYVAAFKKGDKAEIEKFEKEIGKRVDAFNANIIRTMGIYEKETGSLNHDDLVGAKVYEVRSEYAASEIEKTEDLILNGGFTPEIFAAGAASRLGLGNMFSMTLNRFLNVATSKKDDGSYVVKVEGLSDKDREALAEQVKKIISEFPEYADLPMGGRILLQYRADIEQIVRNRNKGLDETAIQSKIKEALNKQKISLLVNAEVVGEVEKILVESEFYGFNRENVFITIQPTFKGYTIEQNTARYNKEGKEEIVNGHGYPSMQKFFPEQAFVMGEYGERLVINDPLTKVLFDRGVKILSIYRINDMSKYESGKNAVEGNALDVPTVLESIKELGDFDNLDHPSVGADVIVETVDNPTKQKGGLFISNKTLIERKLGVMPDTLAFSDAASVKAIERIEQETGAGIPYNAMRQNYKVASLQKTPDGVTPYIRFRKFDDGKPFQFAAETVTGDLTYALKSSSVKKGGRKIRDFKKSTEMKPIVERFGEQNRLFKSLNIKPKVKVAAASLGNSTEKVFFLEHVEADLESFKNHPVLLAFSQEEWNTFGPDVQDEIVIHIQEGRVIPVPTHVTDASALPKILLNAAKRIPPIAGELSKDQFRSFKHDDKIIYLSQNALQSTNVVTDGLTPEQKSRLFFVKQAENQQGILSAALLFASGLPQYAKAFKEENGFLIATPVALLLAEITQKILADRVVQIAA